MYLYEFSLLVTASLTLAALQPARRGWLARLVQHHRSRLLEDLRDLRDLPAVQIKASVQRAPAGYRDASGWDERAALRLAALLARSPHAAPARRALRRALASRRAMGLQDTFKAFPSLMKNHWGNDFYYDVESELDEELVTEPADGGGGGDGWGGDVIVVANPVEARLPSAMISVGLLRSILEARAVAARYLPTARSKIPWTPITITKTKPGTTGSPQHTTTGAPDGRDTSATGATHTETADSTPAPTARE